MTAKIPKPFLSPYNPENNEQEIYKKWEESGYFNPDNLPNRGGDTFSIIMPPPNANGRLHAGHGLDMTLKDVATRFERMRGKKALFLPGTDHAGFETQMVFEKKLQKEGRSRFHMKDEELYKEIWDFTQENKQYTEDDLRRLGISCDWSRNTFTLDKDVVEEVQKTFIKMYEDKLVYRGSRLVNWNPKFKTSLSEVETEFIEQSDPFYYLQYGPFVISTVRPETKFGDKYVVVHPDDKRYKKYKHGEKLELEWINGPITATVIKDKAIDMEFGTGVMTITPWHDATDFEIAERHNLDKDQIIGFDGKLLPIAGEFEGKHITNARKEIVEKLEKKGLVVKVEEKYNHTVRICSRTKVPIEPQIKEQWFVKMKPLADKVINSVEKKKEIEILPSYQKKILLHWMHNTIDWNISRQIVWGIPIPAWFHDTKCVPIKGKDVSKCKEVVVSVEKPTCKYCDASYTKDPDTFDTWFSSGQWPLLTLKYPNSKDFKDYYPTDLMETGTDLVFKWVPRMIMFGLYLAKKIPFKTVYFHGMVNDEKNRKMSKSKGNVISPVDMSDKFGTDALRMSLMIGNPPGGSVALSPNKVKGYKHFANKVWNASRFVLENLDGFDFEKKPKITKEHQAHLNTLNEKVTEITKMLEDYRFDLAADTAYHYFWHTFADVIIEENKTVLLGEDSEEKKSAQWTLYTILTTCLKLLHPCMPFVTEAVWSHLKMGAHKEQKFLMIESWPQST